VHSNRNRKW